MVTILLNQIYKRMTRKETISVYKVYTM